MAKIMVIPNDKESIETLISDAILLGVEEYSVNTLNFSLDEIKKILTTTNKEIFISLNKNMSNSDLKKLENILIELQKYNIKGIFYYDVAILNIVNRLKLNYNLVWSAEHLTTNYYTINYWLEHGASSCFLSNEITIDEMLTIADNTNSHLIVQLFGYIPMYVSKRHAIKNYLKHFNIENESKEYSLFKEEKEYSIVDNDEGTMIYSNFILNGLKEYLIIKDKVDYVLLNGYHIDNINEVVVKFKEVTSDNVKKLEEEINNKFDNLGKGFLHEETIYRVKKNDK